MSAQMFAWQTARPRRRAVLAAQAERRAAMYRAELAERAALYARLGYSSKRALARLKANLAWDFELAVDARPPGLGDRELAEIVKATYNRRPSR